MDLMERAAIISTGDEIMTGLIADTNACYLANHLAALGLEVVSVTAVGDDPAQLRWAWTEALDRADLVISTGGIGPTVDDLTTEVVAEVTGRVLVLDEGVAAHIRALFAAMGRTMPENNLRQARFPSGAAIIPNRLGTAPGYRLEAERPSGRSTLVVLPGVPREMEAMVTEAVLPWLRAALGPDRATVSVTLQTFGLTESALDQMVAGAFPAGPVRISFRASFPQISVRLTARGRIDDVRGPVAEAAARVRERLGAYVYAEGEVSMEEVVGRLLRERGLTVAVAEGCTGGLIAHRLTGVAGSSEYFLGGVLPYANTLKEQVLGSSRAVLGIHGAVSEEAVRELARAVRTVAGAAIGLAVTGVAGPGGATVDKPVGTLCIALAVEDGLQSRQYHLWGRRDWEKLLASQLALDWIRRYCLGVPVTESGLPGQREISRSGTGVVRPGSGNR